MRRSAGMRALAARFLAALAAAGAVLLVAGFGTGESAYGDPPDGLPTIVPSLSTPTASPPTATPLPPPQIPPQDAAGILHTTPPLRAPNSAQPLRPTALQSSAPARGPTPTPQPTAGTLWLGASDATVIAIEVDAGRAYVPVVADGALLHLLLDCNAQTSVVGWRLGGSPLAHAARVGALQIGAARLTELMVRKRMVRVDARSSLRAPPDGVLGKELCALYPVEVDYAGGLLTVYRTVAAARAAVSVGSAVLPLETGGGPCRCAVP
ncbi:MAG: hypothetical protein GIX02_09715 [Candidatus Eremiobacteraeota bacterium]|nr:hypothetical protein [Candidatus Eremiobacteraeota bacterium]